MKRLIISSLLVVVAGLLNITGTGFCANGSPYGGYSKGEGYGESRPVTSVEDAYARLKEYFGRRNVTIGKIIEKELFFEAEVLDRQNNLIDKVIVDKRTGRIRSIY